MSSLTHGLWPSWIKTNLIKWGLVIWTQLTFLHGLLLSPGRALPGEWRQYPKTLEQINGLPLWQRKKKVSMLQHFWLQQCRATLLTPGIKCTRVLGLLLLQLPPPRNPLWRFWNAFLYSNLQMVCVICDLLFLKIYKHSPQHCSFILDNWVSYNITMLSIKMISHQNSIVKIEELTLPASSKAFWSSAAWPDIELAFTAFAPTI